VANVGVWLYKSFREGVSRLLGRAEGGERVRPEDS